MVYCIFSSNDLNVCIYTDSFNLCLKRITIPEIKQHPWFLKNLPKELVEIEKTNFAESERDQPSQSVEEIMRIIQEAKTPAEGAKVGEQAVAGSSDPDDAEADLESEVDVSCDFYAPL